jgi:hypothetical protein
VSSWKGPELEKSLKGWGLQMAFFYKIGLALRKPHHKDCPKAEMLINHHLRKKISQ